jgi:hypothetical protein
MPMLIKQAETPNKAPIVKFIPRDYQEEVMRAAFGVGEKKKNFLYLCWSRGAGKDLLSWSILVRKAIEKPGVYFYCLPNQTQARRVIWETVLSESGMTFRDYIPKGLIKRTSESRMVIELINHSLITIVGSETAPDSLAGTNPSGVVFSETQCCRMPDAYDYIRPRLLLNNGWVLFNGTPRSTNFFYTLHNISKADPDDWFHSYKTCYDTKHLDPVRLEKEKKTMSLDKFMQEYECNFLVGQRGCFWGKEMDALKLDNRVCNVLYNPALPVYASADLGVADPSCFIFFQVIGQTVNIIDYEEHTDRGLDFYAKMFDNKGYKYASTFFPHDIKVRELGSAGAMSRLETARNLGFKAEVVPNVPIDDGIEAVRMVLPRCYIDERKCAKLVEALENYHRVFDETRQTYRERPEHDRFSHAADCMRMLALSLPNCQTGTSQEEITQMYQHAKFGNDSKIPPVFRDNPHNMGRMF